MMPEILFASQLPCSSGHRPTVTSKPTFPRGTVCVTTSSIPTSKLPWDLSEPSGDRVGLMVDWSKGKRLPC